MSITEEREFLTLRDVAARTGLSLHAIEAWVRKGALPTVQPVERGRHLVRREDLERILTPRTREGLK
jgi:excisionase family DNA binding protein